MPTVFAAAVFFLSHLLALAVFSATAFVIGRVATQKLVFHSELERGLVSTALGIALLTQVLFLFGLAGLLRPLPVGLLVVAAHVAGRSAWREVALEFRKIAAGISRRTAVRTTLVALIVLAPLVVLPLYPPTSFDSTMYHLPFAKEFARSGDLPFLPSLRYPVFPQLVEVLFSGVMLFSDDVAAQSLQALMTVLTCGLVFAWGREAFGRAAGWLAAAVYLGNPIVTYLAGTAYVDPALSLFATASLLSVWRLRGAQQRGWAVLTAIFAASAGATKYLGLFFVGVLALAVLLASRRARWTNVLAYATVSFLLLVPCYGRIVLYTGNPLFPYFSGFFGSSAWMHARSALRPVSPVSALTLPWDLAFRRDLFNRQPPISPLYLLTLPLAVVAAVRDRRIRPMILVIVGYVACALSLARDPRYFLPILPLVSLVVGAGVALLPFLRGRWFVLAAAVFLAPGWLYAGWQIRRMGPIPVTAEQRNEFLSRRLPVYESIRFMNRTRGASYTLYALHAENMPYFADGRFLGDWFGPASFERMLAGTVTPESLHTKLRGVEAEYFLVPRDAPAPPQLEDPRSAKLFRIVYSDAHARIYALAVSAIRR